MFYLGKVYFKKEFYLKANEEFEQLLELAKTVKNDPEITEQIEKARKPRRKRKTYQRND